MTVLSQSRFQRQRSPHVSDSFTPGICLNSSGRALQVPSSAGKYWGRLTRLIKHCSTHVPLPPPAPMAMCAHARTHTRTPSPSRKLLFAKSEWNSDFQRVSLACSSTATRRRKVLVCVVGTEREGPPSLLTSISAPRKTHNWLHSRQPHPASVTFLPFLSPHWVAPANQPPQLPPRQRGDLGRALVGQPAIPNEARAARV